MKSLKIYRYLLFLKPVLIPFFTFKALIMH